MLFRVLHEQIRYAQNSNGWLEYWIPDNLHNNKHTKLPSREDELLDGMEGLEKCPFCSYRVFIDSNSNQIQIFECQRQECRKKSCRTCKKLVHFPLCPRPIIQQGHQLQHQHHKQKKYQRGKRQQVWINGAPYTMCQKSSEQTAQIMQKPRQIEAQAAQPKPKSRPPNPQNQDVPPSNFHMIIQKPKYANIVGMKKARVYPCRSVDFTNIYENEYRIAESAFYRNLRNRRDTNIKYIEFILNPTLQSKFDAKQAEFKERKIPDKFVHTFHGTQIQNIDSICTTNLNRIDRAAHGHGYYFSDYPDVSLGKFSCDMSI